MSQSKFSSAASSPSLQPLLSSTGNTTSPTSPEDQSSDPLADLRLLLQYVARAFYDVRHILLFDQLIRKEAMKDEELATRLGITPRDLVKAANQLVRDQLISTYVRSEHRPGAFKPSQRTYYFIDYKHCVDVIKWRMWKMNKMLDDKQRNVIDGQGYVCPLCKKTYSTLDISGLSMTATSFLCEICASPLDDNENDIEVQKNKDRMQRLNSQSMIIKKNLQKAEQVVVPPFDIAKWVAVNVPLESAVDSSDGLAVATGGAKETAVTVQLADEGDMEAKKQLAEQEAQAKRQANALPVWIAQSTVSGEMTRAGIKEGPISNFQGQQDRHCSGVSLYEPTATHTNQSTTSNKNNTIDDDIDYDAYFANLQAQSQSTCSSTLSIESKRSPADNSSLGSPSHLRQLSNSSINGNNNLKRNRGTYGDNSYPYDDRQNQHSANGNKKLKVDLVQQIPFNSPPNHPTLNYHQLEKPATRPQQSVLVSGKLVPLDEVTEFMENQMTPEEYDSYARLALAHSWTT